MKKKFRRLRTTQQGKTKEAAKKNRTISLWYSLVQLPWQNELSAENREDSYRGITNKILWGWLTIALGLILDDWPSHNYVPLSTNIVVVSLSSVLQDSSNLLHTGRLAQLFLSGGKSDLQDTAGKTRVWIHQWNLLKANSSRINRTILHKLMYIKPNLFGVLSLNPRVHISWPSVKKGITPHHKLLIQYIFPHQFLIHTPTKEPQYILIGFKLSAARQEYNYTIKPLCDWIYSWEPKGGKRPSRISLHDRAAKIHKSSTEDMREKNKQCVQQQGLGVFCTAFLVYCVWLQVHH